MRLAKEKRLVYRMADLYMKYHVEQAEVDVKVFDPDRSGPESADDGL